MSERRNNGSLWWLSHVSFQTRVREEEKAVGVGEVIGGWRPRFTAREMKVARAEIWAARAGLMSMEVADFTDTGCKS